jgi:hypothetical protein
MGGRAGAVVAESISEAEDSASERRNDVHQAFLDIGAQPMICWRYVQRFC